VYSSSKKSSLNIIDPLTCKNVPTRAGGATRKAKGWDGPACLSASCRPVLHCWSRWFNLGGGDIFAAVTAECRKKNDPIEVHTYWREPACPPHTPPRPARSELLLHAVSLMARPEPSIDVGRVASIADVSKLRCKGGGEVVGRAHKLYMYTYGMSSAAQPTEVGGQATGTHAIENVLWRIACACDRLPTEGEETTWGEQKIKRAS